MTRIGIACLCLLLIGPSLAVADPAAWAALREGGHIALMRHADAPGGAGDPPGFRLEDCATQRNLSERGRAEAAAMGAAFRAERVVPAKILSSPWCRCRETASLTELGPVEIEPAFSNAFVLSESREALAQEARAVIDAWKGGTLLVVTHGANIQALTGRSPAAGEIVVVAARGPGPLAVVGRISPPSR